MTLNGHALSPARVYRALQITLPLGFESCYGAPPLAEQHRGVKPLVGGAVEGTIETFSAAVEYYKQQLRGFKGVVDDGAHPLMRSFLAEVRRVLGPTFGPIIAFVAHGRLYGAAPEFKVEDGSDENSPMRGPRPLVFQLDYALENPDAIDEIGSTLAADLIQRGIPIVSPLTGKLPVDLQERNQDLLDALASDPESLPLVSAA